MAMNMGIMLLISGGITLLVKAIDKAIVTTKEAIETGTKAKETIKSINDELKTNTEYVSENAKSYAELKQGIGAFNKNISLSEEDYQKYLKENEKLAEIFPNLITGHDSENNAILNLNGSVKDITDSLDDYIKTAKQSANQKIVDNFGDVLSGSTAQIKEYQKEIEKLERKRDNLYNTANYKGVNLPLQEYSDSYGNTSYIPQKVFSTEIEAENLISRLNAAGVKATKGKNIQTDKFSTLYQVEFDYDETLFNNSIDTARDKIDNEIQNFKDKINQEKINLSPSVQAILNTSVVYESFGNDIQNAISQITTNLDFVGKTEEQARAMIDEVVAAFNGDSGKEVQKAISKLFSLKDNKDISTGEWEEQVNELLKIVKDILGDNAYEVLIKLGFDTKNLNSEIDGIIKKSNGTLSRDWIESLNDEQIHILYSLDDIGSKSPEELLAEINKLIEKAEEPFSFNISSFNGKIEEIYNKYDLLSKAFDEFEEKGIVTASTFKSLTDNNLLQYLDFSSGKLRILADDLYKSEEALKIKTTADLKAALYSDLHTLAVEGVTDAELEAQKQSIDTGNDIETMSNKFANSVPNIISAANAIDTYSKVSGGQGTLEGKEEQINKLVDLYNKTVVVIGNMGSETRKTSKAFGGLGKSAKQAADEAKKGLEDTLKAGHRAIDELVSMTVNMLKQKANNAKDSLEKHLETLRNNFEKEKKYVEDLIDGYKRYVDARKDALNEDKNSEDYQKQLDKRNKEVANIESKILEIGNDDSAEGIKKKLELQEQLFEKQSELEDFQKDKSHDKAINALDKEYERYEEFQKSKLDGIEEEYNQNKERKDRQLKDLEEYLSNTVELNKEAYNLIEGKSIEYYNDLLDWNARYGSGIKNDVVIAWDNAYKSLEHFGLGEKSVLTILNDLVLSTNDFKLEMDGACSAIDKAAQSAEDLNNNLKDIANRRKFEFDFTTKDKGFYPAGWGSTLNIKGYSSGGVNTDTGIAMLHGTNNQPETIFNSTDSSKLWNLVKTLPYPILQTPNFNINSKTLNKNLKPMTSPVFNMGDIVIQGNADNNTVNAMESKLKQTFKQFVDEVTKLNQQGGNSINPKFNLL